MKVRKPYRIIGAYDSETTNIKINGIKSAFPILHQIGLIDSDTCLKSIYPDNVESIVDMRMFRHAFELYSFLDSIVESQFDYVPVICCHNLAFDMYSLAEWLDAHEVRVLAKSRRKPITFTILDDEGQPRLVIWDTLVFAQKPLSMMGHECGYEKLSGAWDYEFIRTPETELSPDELAYASHDIYALIAWLGYFCRLNPDIDETSLARNIVTKTGIIRFRRVNRFSKIKCQGSKYDVGRFWNYLNRSQMPKDDYELFTMHAATRGGFTFCSSRWANVPITIDKGMRVYGYDATSQHPAQMVSRYYPRDFHLADTESLESAFRIVGKKDIAHILAHHDRPFSLAFYGLFEFENLRPREGSLFEREGIYPLASARFSKREIDNNDNGASDRFNDYAFASGYRDTANNPKFLFGKLASADSCRLYITELTAWEIWQAYEFDSVRALGGYLTFKFIKPSDMAIISVMQFYDAKNEFKNAMREYRECGCIDSNTAKSLMRVNISDAVINDMENGTIADDDLEFVYLGLKADLNGLFGIEATNEYRCDTVLTSNGIDYAGEDGIGNAPKNPKAWYQFGQRIVGWSRIAQICIMQLGYSHCAGIANGDTDSVKFVLDGKSDISTLENALEKYSSALDKGKSNVCARVKSYYPEVYSSLDEIGHYVREFEADHFYCAWNKAYCIYDGEKFDFTIAGIPSSSSHRDIDLNRIAAQMRDDGMGFAQICDELLGFNITYSNDVTGLNARILPQWADVFTGRVKDYRGHIATVAEPRVLALFPLAKTINASDNEMNSNNLKIALKNNPDVCIEPRTLYYHHNHWEIIRTCEMHSENV